MGKIISSGLRSLIAVGAGNGGAIGNAILAVEMPIGNPPQGAAKLVIRKIAWMNNIGVNGQLLLGYADRTGGGALFRQVFPNVMMVNGIQDEWQNPPIMGNTREGFMVDTTLITGSLGDIYVECTTAGIGAAPNNVFVIVEAELF